MIALYGDAGFNSRWGLTLEIEGYFEACQFSKDGEYVVGIANDVANMKSYLAVFNASNTLLPFFVNVLLP